MGKFSESDKKRLLSSPFVEKISVSHVVFTVRFKTLAIKKNLEGTSAADTFSELGIDPTLFLPDFPRKSITRWKQTYFEHGIEGFEQEKRGKGATGRPKQKFNSLEEEVTFLREENDLLKKLQALAEDYLKKNGSH